MSDYNYERFRSGLYDFEVFGGPDAGDRYRDAELHTLGGQPVRLSDLLRDKPLVLETGSLTCPMYGNNVPSMQRLAAKYPQLDFALMYVREAHPGERVAAHASLKSKTKAARKSCRHHGDRRRVLIDDVKGTAHKLYGSMPNSIFVIAPDGTVLFRSIWNNAEEMDAVLAAVARGYEVESRDLKPRPPFTLGSMRTLMAGGIVALYDFFVSLVSLVGKHRRRGNM